MKPVPPPIPYTVHVPGDLVERATHRAVQIDGYDDLSAALRAILVRYAVGADAAARARQRMADTPPEVRTARAQAAGKARAQSDPAGVRALLARGRALRWPPGYQRKTPPRQGQGRGQPATATSHRRRVPGWPLTED